MSDDMESRPMEEYRNNCYIGTVDDRTDRFLQPDRQESGVRINRLAVFGIFCCLFLILLGLGANLYFVINNTRDYATETRAIAKQSTQESPTTFNDDQLDFNLTLSDENGLLDIAAKIWEVAKSVSSLQAKFAKWEKDNCHAVSNQHEHAAQKIDVIIQSMNSLTSTTDVMQKKLDKVDVSVVQSKNAIFELNTTVIALNLKSNTDIINQLDTLETAVLSNRNQSEENVQAMMDVTQKKLDKVDASVVQSKNAISDLNTTVIALNLKSNTDIINQLDTLETAVLSNRNQSEENVQSMMDVTQKKLDKVDASVVQSKNAISDLNTTVIALNLKSNTDIINQLDTLETAVLSNRNQSEENVQAMMDIISNVTSGLSDQTQRNRQEIINENNVSLSKAVETLERKTDEINLNIGSTRNLIAELNGSVHEMVIGLKTAVGTILHQNEDLVKNNSIEFKELSHKTVEILVELMNNTTAGFEDATVSQKSILQILKLVSKDLNKTQDTLKEHFETKLSMEQKQIEILENMTLEFDELKTGMNKLETYSVSFNRYLTTQTEKLADLNSTFKAVVDNQITESRIFLEMSENNLLNISSQISICSRDRQCIEQSPIEIPKPITSMLNSINSSLTSIELSVTLNSSKLEDLTLSSAIVKLLDQTNTVHEAIVNASNQQPTCRDDGCYVKVIPVGLPASTTFVQKENVRLANANISPGSIRGRLEVYVGNSWGTVCDDSFENVDAAVVCRMFGYSSGTQKQAAFFGQGRDPIKMDDVQCSGSESSIFSCSHVTAHNCGHGEDVGVICT